MKKLLLIFSFIVVSLSTFAQTNKYVNLIDEKVETYLENQGLLGKLDPDLSFRDEYQNKTRYVLVQYCGAIAVFDVYSSGNVNIVHKSQCLSEDEQAKIWMDEVKKYTDGTIARHKFLR
ncbi:hypothetical protein [Flammeovirga agarivorans]|uniref:Secreted protein n=1 Tax=Flammeovirga agarivorans TaxID=2726742 RepID=A0A7X8SM73_9BACT|nr:hypothetical protein [Flammeovirga agarivorans]NLR92790.1 hypothetical protein [Flammeovirga agarivorans]